MKNIFKLLFLNFILLVTFISVPNVFAADPPSSLYGAIKSAIQSGGSPLTGNAVQGTVPRDFAGFSFGNVSNPASVTYSGGMAVSDSLKTKWKNYTEESETWKAVFGGSGIVPSKAPVATSTTDEVRDYKVCFPRLGMFANRWVDVEGQVIDYRVSESVKDDDSSQPNTAVMAITNGSSQVSISQRRSVLSVESLGLDYIRVLWSFTASDTATNGPCSGTPYVVNGNTTYWDVDNQQGISFWDSSPVRLLYISSSNNALRFTNLSWVKADGTYNKPYVYYNTKDSVPSTTKENAFSEIFSGASIERVYSFYEADKSSVGGMQHSPEAPVVVETPPPTKAVSTDYVDYQTTFTYTVRQNVPIQLPEYYYQSFWMQDTLDPAHDMSKTTVDKIKVLNVTSNNADVTSYFDITVQDNVVKATAKATTLANDAFYGSTYELVIPAQFKLGQTYVNQPDRYDYSSYQKDQAGFYIVNNQPVTYVNNTPLTGNVVQVKVAPPPEKLYDGTSYDDNKGWNHHEVKMPNEKRNIVGDDIKYKITLASVNSDEIITITDVLSKGLTYNKDSKLNGVEVQALAEQVNSETKTTSIVWQVKVPKGTVASFTYSARVNSDAINFVNNNATAKYGDGPVLDIGSLHNPVPRKEYDVNTANGMNGKIVQKNDIITYNIGYSNGFLTSATLNLRDTLSDGLTYKAGTAKICDHNKENCKSLEEAGVTEKVITKEDGKTEIYWTRRDMPSLGIEIIVYQVKVTGKTIRVENDFDFKICKNAEAIEKTDTIEGCTEQLNKSCEPRCTVGVDDGCKAATDESCSATKQECSMTGYVCNSPWTDIEELKNPVPVKRYDENTPSGYNHAAVAERNRIRYEIRYVNVADEKVTATIKDTLSKGIEYVRGTSKINGKKIADPKLSNKNKTLTWKRELEKDQEESLTYEVIVTGETTKVINKASIIYSNNPEYERVLKRLVNPVPQKTYSRSTKAGYNGATVKKNDVITYSIKYSNVKDTASSVIIMDNLSKGLEYVKGSSRVNGKKINPLSVTKDANGTMLVWTKEIASGKDEELTYDVRVTGEKLLVENNASIQYDDDPVIKLDELRNPLLNNQFISIPDTGSNIAIISIVTGIILVASGGYLIYRKSFK